MAKPRESYLELSRRPVYCLIFLAPLLIGYEIGVLIDHRSLLAEQMLRDFLTLRGRTFNFLSGMFVLAVMVAWQIGSGQPWAVRARVLGLMLLEAAALTLPLFLLYAAIPRTLSSPRPPAFAATAPAGLEREGSADPGAPPPQPSPARGEGDESADGEAPSQPTPADGADAPRAPRLLREIAISLGAGPYEELIFRLFLVETLIWLLMHGIGSDERTATVVAVLVSATLFAGYHYLPGTAETFTWGSFLFRTGAGIYFSLVFVVRGFGIAAGCHTFYDILVDIVKGP